MIAQDLYDDRELTGFCSGNDLHEFFQEQLGDPSPGGHTNISKDAVYEFVLNCAMGMKQNSPTSFYQILGICKYCHSTVELAFLAAR